MRLGKVNKDYHSVCAPKSQTDKTESYAMARYAVVKQSTRLWQCAKCASGDKGGNPEVRALYLRRIAAGDTAIMNHRR